MSDPLWPRGLQHASLLCPSPTPGACSNSCPLSRWCHPTISSSVVPFASCLQSFPASGSYQVKMSDTFSLFPPFGDPWPSCLLPSQLDYKESWVPKNWCFWTVVLEKTLESPLDCKEIQPVHPKGNQSWIFIGRTDAEAEGPIVWPPDRKSWLIWKDLDAGKDWWQEEKGITEDEMVGWHHWLDGH